MIAGISRVLLFLLQYMFLFAAGTISGWLLELFWRRFAGKNKRWINPGFLHGPWLPLYGFGTVLLYILCSFNLPFYILMLIFFFGLTGLEYIAGLIFIKHFKIKLWDYSQNRGNIQGLICPLYSLLWTLLGLFFSFFLYPLLKTMIDHLYLYLDLSFFVGIYAGLLAVDLWQSFDIAARIRLFVEETEEKWPIDFETFKLELRDRVRVGFRNRTHFFLPFRGELGTSFRENLTSHTRNLAKTLKPIRQVLKKSPEKQNGDK